MNSMKHTITKELFLSTTEKLLLARTQEKGLYISNYIHIDGKIVSNYLIIYRNKTELVTKDLDEAITKYNEL